MTFTEKFDKGYSLLNDHEKRLVSYIPFGKEHSTTAPRLEPFTGMTQHQLSNFARRLMREKGYPVIAWGGGFYHATSDKEVKDYKRKEEKRKRGIERNIAACDAFLNA